MTDSSWDLSRAKLNMSREEYVKKRARDALELIRKAKVGKIALLLAVREIVGPVREPELQKQILENDFWFVIAVSSECDGLPLGDERQYWAADSLREKDLQAKSYEEKISSDLLPTLDRIADSLNKTLQTERE